MATTATNSLKAARARASQLLTRYAEVSAELDRLKTERKPLDEEYSSLRQQLQAYADDSTNAADFKEKATLGFPELGSFGYRAGTEKLAWNLEVAPAEADRTAAVCAALKKLLPTAIKMSYDEKAIVKVWGHMPKLQDQLAELGVVGVVRERQFIISLKK